MMNNPATPIERCGTPLKVAIALMIFACNQAAFAQTNQAPEPTRLPPSWVFGGDRSLHDVDSESELVGPANQPEWTTRRVFTETDVYVIPFGEIEFNQFYILSQSRHEKPVNEFESELEFGLPWRTQFDVEMNYEVTGGRLAYDSTMIEMPHALADWGKIPFNPAINAGWRFKTEGADSYILRLLLAEQFGEKFYFGGNLSFERQIGDELETTYEFNAALNYRLIDRRLSVGAQLVVEYETAHEREFDADENEWEREWTHSADVLFGPTVLYRPTRNLYLGLAPLFGLTTEAPTIEAYFLLGIDFEPGTLVAAKEDDALRAPRLRRPR